MGWGGSGKRAKTRRRQPSLEGLEPRELPSGLHAMGRDALAPRHVSFPSLNLIVASRVANVDLARANQAQAGTPGWVNHTYLNSLASELYAPVTTTQPIEVNGTVFPPGTYATPQPRPREIKRETFWATFSGRYYVGPPRFSNQAATIHIYSAGRNVASNWFLHGRGQVLVFPPADPNATPTTLDPVAGQNVGIVSLIPSNALQTSDMILLDLNNLPGKTSNDPTTLDHGLPARLGFTLDTAGAGAFTSPNYATTPAVQTDPSTGQPLPIQGGAAGAVAFTQGLGMIELKYIPDNRLRAGASQSGTVIVRIQGLINYSGTLNALYKGIN